jgi:hypothetical protein
MTGVRECGAAGTCGNIRRVTFRSYSEWDGFMYAPGRCERNVGGALPGPTAPGAELGSATQETGRRGGAWAHRSRGIE